MPVFPAVASITVPTRLEPAFTLGARNYADRGPVFYAAAGIQILKFGKNIGRTQAGPAFHLQHRRFADQFRYVVTEPQTGT